MSTASSSTDLNGPYVIGYTLCFALMGALAVQSYIYFTRSTGDRRSIKALVSVVLLLETAMTALTFSGFWLSTTSRDFSTTGIGPSALASSFIVIGPISGLVTTLTQGFYCWRISTLRRSRLIPILIMTVSLFQLVSIIDLALADDLAPSTAAIRGIQALTSSPPRNLVAWLPLWLGSSLVCDLSITICMVISLHPSGCHFGSKSTLVKLTRLTIETGLVTTVAALVELILAAVFQQQMYHIAVFYAISKLYSNCLLASLNFRLVLRSQSNPDLTTIVWDNASSNTQLGLQACPITPLNTVKFLPQVRPDVNIINIELNETSSNPEGSGTNSFINSIRDQPRETHESLDRFRSIQV